MNTAKSEQLFTKAQTRIPGGVNSPVRAFRPGGGLHFFVGAGAVDHRCGRKQIRGLCLFLGTGDSGACAS